MHVKHVCVCSSRARWPVAPNFCSWATRNLSFFIGIIYAGHTGFHKFRALSSHQFFLEHSLALYIGVIMIIIKYFLYLLTLLIFFSIPSLCWRVKPKLIFFCWRWFSCTLSQKTLCVHVNFINHVYALSAHSWFMTTSLVVSKICSVVLHWSPMKNLWERKFWIKRLLTLRIAS